MWGTSSAPILCPARRSVKVGGGILRTRLRVGHAALTILLSWAFIQTIFALHYAHEFYDVTAGGLAFPQGSPDPGYGDFVEVRRIVAAHGVLSFVFNAALLALTVNLAAGAL